MPIDRRPGKNPIPPVAAVPHKELDRIARGHAGRKVKVKLLEERQKAAQELYYNEDHDPSVVVNNVAPALHEKPALAEWYWKRAWAIGQLAVRAGKYDAALAALRQMREISIDILERKMDEPIPALPINPLSPKPEPDRALRDLDEAQAEGQEILARFQSESYRQGKEE